jgi:peptidoglycan hydrolase-like protein with peptidoglycan-binding domain
MRFYEFKTLIKEDAGIVLSVPTGRSGPEVADVQKALLAMNITTPAELGNLGRNKDGVDGIRGPLTSAAVKKFQTQAGIGVDGDPGPETIDALNKAIASNPNIKFSKSTEDDVSPSARRGARSQNIDISVIQDPDFNKKVKLIADNLGVEPSELMRIMKFESGLKTGHQGGSSHKAVGLIQFIPDTARDLGTSSEELAQMTAIQQLDYVYKFYKMNGLKPGSDLGTMYMITFMPAYAYAPEDTVLGQQGGGELGKTGLSMDAIWQQNPAFSNGGPKGKPESKKFFTVGDVKKTINAYRG